METLMVFFFGYKRKRKSGRSLECEEFFWFPPLGEGEISNHLTNVKAAHLAPISVK